MKFMRHDASMRPKSKSMFLPYVLTTDTHILFTLSFRKWLEVVSPKLTLFAISNVAIISPRGFASSSSLRAFDAYITMEVKLSAMLLVILEWRERERSLKALGGEFSLCHTGRDDWHQVPSTSDRKCFPSIPANISALLENGQSARTIIVYPLPTAHKVGEMRRGFQEDNKGLVILGIRWLQVDDRRRRKAHCSLALYLKDPTEA